ncbi:major facilitator superfamily transporter [Nemania sp. NC0429]|nr:major facilitator superfamily transporter [Nemania sp. NC0429]
MENNEALFRNSVWSHDNGDISLHSLDQLDVSWTDSSDDMMYSTRDPVSKFSADSEDDDENLLFITICIAHLCAQAGIGQTLPIIKGLGSRFRVVNANTLSPSIAAYAVAVGTFILVASRLGEAFGHKRIFIAGLLWSAIWPLIAGASFYSTRSLFIFSRALQGLGAAFTLPTGLELLRATNPTGIRKTVLFTVYAAMPPIGLILGALVASSFVTLAWWPWTYWAHSMTLTVVGAASFFTIPPAPQSRSLPSGASAIILRLDIPGMVTGTMSLGLFGFAWCQAHVVGWHHSYIWIIIVMSIVLAGLFVMIEGCYAPKPLIPYSALSSEVFWILVAVGCGWSCFGIWIFYGWQLVGRLRSTPALLTTAYFSPIVVIGCVATVASRCILMRSRPHVVFCVAMLAMMIGGVLISTMPRQQTYWGQPFLSIIAMAWGAYMSVPVATFRISRAVRKTHAGIAESLVWMVTYYGVGLGLGVAGTIETKAMGGKLTAQHRLRGYRAAFWTSVGFAVFGLVVLDGLACGEEALLRRLTTERGIEKGVEIELEEDDRKSTTRKSETRSSHVKVPSPPAWQGT